MNILYDFQAFKQRYGGISRYHYELFKLIPATDKTIEVTFTPLISNNYYLNTDASIAKIELQNTPLKRSFKGRDFLVKSYNKIRSINAIKNNQFDVFHPTYYDPYFLKSLKKPFVVTVHDFIHEKFDQYALPKEIDDKRKLIERADRIIAISANTKNDLLELYPQIPEKKIEVIYHGYTDINYGNNFSNNMAIQGNYLLYVGKRTSYKNFQPFLKAITPILKKNRDIKLVCAGIPFTRQEVLLFEEAGLLEKIIAIPATDEQLSYLYKNALAFIFPSLYEGFGLPILEAFSNNCPAIISNSSCFPEIGKDAALYFDPSDIDSIYQTINKVIFDEELKKNMISRGSQIVKDFTWEQTAKKTIELYKNLVS